MTLELDSYGFPTKMSEESKQLFASVISPRHAKQETVWFDYIKSISGTENLDLKSKHFKKLVRHGVPECERSHIWCKVLGVFRQMDENAGFYINSLRTSATIDPSIMEQIMLDVPRTFAGATSFSAGPLLNVLKVFAIRHPKIGYCQSLNFMAAIVLAIVGEEEPAFWALNNLVENYFPPQYFVPSMFDFTVDLHLVKLLVAERTPDLEKVSAALHYDWIQCASGWLLTVFANSFPISTVLRIWDSFLLEGPKIVFRVIVAFLRLSEDAIKNCHEQNELPGLIRRLEANAVDEDRLMDAAFSIKLFSRKHLNALREEAKKNIVENGFESNQPKVKACLQSLFGQLKM